MRFSFLGFVSRSGSTLLSRLLAEHAPELVVLPEFTALDLLIGAQEDRVREMTEKQILSLFEMDLQWDNLCLSSERCRTAAAARTMGIRSIAQHIVEAYAEARGIEKATCALLKRGSYFYLQRDIRAIFPEARFIHIIRDPRAVVSSLMRTPNVYMKGVSLGRDVYHVARAWRRYCEYADFIGRDGAPLLEIRYEDLCEDGIGTIRLVSEFLEVGYSPKAIRGRHTVGKREQEIHKLVNRPTQLSRTDAWAKELPAWQGTVVEILVRNRMREKCYQDWFLTQRSRVGAFFCYMWGLTQHIVATIRYAIVRAFFYMKNYGLMRTKLRQALFFGNLRRR